MRFRLDPRDARGRRRALDALLLIDAPTVPGSTLRNDRLVAVSVKEVNRPRIRRLGELDPARIDEIEHFFYS